METASLKRFAQQARRSLQDQVSSKLKFVLAPESAARREHPTAVQKLEEAIKKHGKPVVVDQVAYTWFNRFCALRFMDANRYNRVNIVSPTESWQFQPEILAEAKLGHIDESLVDEKVRQKVNRLLSGADPSRDPQAEAYRLLIVAACNYWNGSMPFLFQRIDDYTELLLPDDLLSENSILTQTREALTDGACQDVEVIGWLYQFYISEKKDDVMSRKSAVPTEDIPAVTQLFTPHWIVRYLVENSLGRLWMLNRPGSRLAENMDYYIKPKDPEKDYRRIESVVDIKVCDPACGSGHMLTYAFDLLYAMYEEEGYAAPEIPKLILSNNLFGIEIDDRAGELAAFALTMKARAKDRRIFSRNVTPQITVLEDIQFDAAELGEYKRHINDNHLFTPDVQNLLYQFENAKTFGSLIQPVVSEHKIIRLREELIAREPVGDLYLRDTHLKVIALLNLCQALSQRYHVVVANPPYMNSTAMNDRLREFVKQNFPHTKSNLFGAFVGRITSLVFQGCFTGMMIPFTWMFLSSFEALRLKISGQYRLMTLVRPEYHAIFDSAHVEICAFTVFSNSEVNARGSFVDLQNFYGSDLQADKFIEAIKNPECGWFFLASSVDFNSIPGRPFAFWVSEKVREIFKKSKSLADIAEPRQGMATGDNGRFVRCWHEVGIEKIGFSVLNRKDAGDRRRKWFPYNKGGYFKRWYGNQEYVVNWSSDGLEIRNFYGDNGKLRSRPQNIDYFFLPSVSWSQISSGLPAFRYFPQGFAFDVSWNLHIL